LSFKQAAEELNLTPSAISHAVQTLEEWLGTPLFSRAQRTLSLTQAGQRLLQPVEQAFDILAAATDRIPGRRAAGVLSVSVPTTFASRWLIPRLHRFTERYPDISVAIHTEGRGIDVPLAGTDLAIRMASAPKAGGTWLRLVRETFVPVCSPTIAERLMGQSFEEMLQTAPLIHVTTVAEDWHWWCKVHNIKPPRGNQHLRFDTIRLAIGAALQGLGIAIGRRPLVDDDLASGRLVAIGSPPRQGATCYWLIGEEATFARSEAKLFRSWLIDEMQALRP